MTTPSTRKNNHPKRTSPTRNAKPTGDKPVYISLNLDELAALEAFGYRERWAYIAFKRIANFKTGVAGRFGKQHLTYVELAKRLSPPPGVQGRGQGAIDDTQARDILLAFEQAGLVANIGRRADNGGLCFELPLSPIGAKKQGTASALAAPPATPTSRPTAGEFPDNFPDDEPAHIPAKPMLATLPADWPAPLSVVINKKIQINTEGANLGTAEVAPCRATGAAPILEKIQPGTAETAAVAAVATTAETAAPLSAAEIERILQSNWDFTGVETPAARARYAAWAKAGITRLDLDMALALTQPERDELLTPADLDANLWPLGDDGGHRLAA